MLDGVGYAAGWLAVALVLGALSLPLAARLFEPRPERGAAFAVPLGLAWLTLGTFWLGRLDLGLAPVAAVALLAAVALAVDRRRDGPRPVRAFAEAAAVFAAGYLLVLVVTAADPAITASGETYWNVALVQSLLRTSRLPPVDPWFAGEAVRYYYGGHLLLAALAELLATPGRFAFGLGKAVVFGALLSAAYGLAGAAASARDRPARPAGLLGAFAVGLASNLHPPLWGVLAVLPDGVAVPVASAVGLEPDPTGGLAAFTLLDAAHFSFTNTDFPAYTLWLAGIHPHWVSPVFLLLLAGVLLAYFLAPAGARRRRLALLAATTPLAGLVAFVNTWSLPAAGGLVALTVALAPAHPGSLVVPPERLASLPPARDWAARVAAGALAGVAAALLGLAWVAPYVLRGFAGDPALGLLPARSGAWYFVVGYGGFLLAFAAFLAVELRGAGWSRRTRRGAAAAAVGLLAVGWLADAAGLVLVGPVLLGGLALLARDRRDFAGVLLVAGAGLALLVEVAYVAETAEPGRYNTVYKVYMQTWVLWGPAAGVALARLYRAEAPDRDVPWGPAFVVVLVAALSVYAVTGVYGHVGYALSDEADPTLDGLAYLETEHPDHAAAIAWLASHPGQPVLVSAPATEGRLYQFNASPAASLTGLPTLVGWNHEADYRGVETYRERVRVVDTVYAGTRAQRARALRAHDVRFVWVGPAERDRYRVVDYAREPGLETAFRAGNVTVYRVDPAELATGSGTSG